MMRKGRRFIGTGSQHAEIFPEAFVNAVTPKNIALTFEIPISREVESMEVSIKTFVILTVGALLISGCDYSPTILPVSEATPGVEFNVVPDKLRICDPPRAVKVSWNAAAAGVSVVKIFVRGEAVADKLFASGGATGSADTGPWVSAETVFILKDGGETKQLAKIVVGSKTCD